MHRSIPYLSGNLVYLSIIPACELFDAFCNTICRFILYGMKIHKLCEVVRECANIFKSIRSCWQWSFIKSKGPVNKLITLCVSVVTSRIIDSDSSRLAIFSNPTRVQYEKLLELTAPNDLACNSA